MKILPLEIKIYIIVAILLLLVIVVFLIFIIVMYYRKQMIFARENTLKAMEHETQLLQKEVEFQKRSQLEQQRISHDMHDDVGSGITALKLQIEFIKQKTTDLSIKENIQEMLETCEGLHVSLRQILWNLKVGDDNVENFTQKVSHYIETFFGKTDILVQIYKEGLSADFLSADMRRNIFLSIKEALNNAYKHSQCDHIEVYFIQKANIFEIEIKDDGIGMSNENRIGNGLGNMKSRMSSINGEFILLPSKKGLHICLRVDLEKI